MISAQIVIIRLKLDLASLDFGMAEVRELGWRTRRIIVNRIRRIYPRINANWREYLGEWILVIGIFQEFIFSGSVLTHFYPAEKLSAIFIHSAGEQCAALMLKELDME